MFALVTSKCTIIGTKMLHRLFGVSKFCVCVVRLVGMGVCTYGLCWYWEVSICPLVVEIGLQQTCGPK